MLRFPRILALVLACCFISPAVGNAFDIVKPFDDLPEAFAKKIPETVDDLKTIQAHVSKVVDKVMPCVVSVRIGAMFGSGVIVTKDGYVLTAGHVSGEPGRDVTVYFHDGKKAKGTTLGGNHGIDSGLIKITTEGDWPCVEMGNSAKLKPGQWCMVCAHPGGFKPGRTPPVRLGRVSRVQSTTLWTDCILVGGDSGGPLFDMHGRVIGINSRIGEKIEMNMHVPVNPFKESWDRLAQGEVIGGKAQAYIGIVFDPNAQGCLIQEVTPKSPAERAGLKVNDTILKFGGKMIDSGNTLAGLVSNRRPGSQVTLEVRRGEETLSLTVELGRR